MAMWKTFLLVAGVLVAAGGSAAWWRRSSSSKAREIVRDSTAARAFVAGGGDKPQSHLEAQKKNKGSWQTCDRSYPGAILPGCLSRTELRQQCQTCAAWFSERYYGEAAIYTMRIIDKIVTDKEDFSEYLLTLRTDLLNSGPRGNTAIKSTTAEQYLVDRQHGILVGWTPRGGCSGVVYSFLDKMNLLDHAKEWVQTHELAAGGPWVHQYRMGAFRKEYGQMKFSELLDRNPRQPLVRVKFVRDPYQRAVSSYTQFCLLMGRSAARFAWFKERYQFPASALRNVSELSFREWIEAMSWVQDKTYGTYHGVDPHWAPQVTVLEGALANVGKPMFDAILQIDHFNFSLMLDVLGQNYTYLSYAGTPHKSHRTSVDPALWTRMPYHQAVKQLPNNYLDIYKPPSGTALEGLVFKVYCLDFSFGGYQRMVS